MYSDVNEAFERLFGVSRQALLGKTSGYFEFWLNAEERARALAILSRDGELLDFESKAAPAKVMFSTCGSTAPLSRAARLKS